MDVRKAELILLKTVPYDMTGLEEALVVVIKDLQKQLAECQNRIQTLIDSTGTWRDFR